MAESRITATLLPEFDQEMASTRRVLERVPAGQLEFRPHDKSYSMLELATHIATIPLWATVTMQTEDFDYAKDAPDRAMPTDHAGILALFDRHVADARAALVAASDDDYATKWTFRNAEHVFFTQPRAAVLRGFVMNHLYHHRGQLTVYLRLTGAKVPQVYGPTADEQ